MPDGSSKDVPTLFTLGVTGYNVVGPDLALVTFGRLEPSQDNKTLNAEASFRIAVPISALKQNCEWLLNTINGGGSAPLAMLAPGSDTAQ